MFQPWLREQAPTSSFPPTQKTRFPDKLREYVRRTFEDCRLEAWPEVETELKKIITDAFNEQVVWSLDWDRMQLPQERLAIKAHGAALDEEKNIPDAWKREAP